MSLYIARLISNLNRTTMTRFKRKLLVLMPLILMVSENAIAGGWHDKLHVWTLTLPPCFQAFIIYLHVILGLA